VTTNEGFGGDREFDRSAVTDLWRRTLNQIPTLFGKISYLASLRDANTGRYRHHGLAQKFGHDEADRAIRQSHMETFRRWIETNLETQKDDLEEYLAALNESWPEVLANWARLALYESIVPLDSTETERDLYRSDFQVILRLLMREHGVGGPDPGA
jgi:hypothetical protein